MLTRREFIKLCMASALSTSLAEILYPMMNQVFAEMNTAKPPVIWLELGSCTGNSVSLENATNPPFWQLLQTAIDLRYHSVFNVTEGKVSVNRLFETVEQEAGKFWLIIEGSVMTADNGRYNHIFLHNNEMVTGLAALQKFAGKAKYIIAVGDCACFGGPAAASPNPGGAKGVWDVISQKVINIPGCPTHPDWLTGTFSHLALYGWPELDAYNRPRMFFGKTIHELCQRRQQFEDGIFALFPGEEGCFYKIGCKGPVTHADCPLRQWNPHRNWPVKAGVPCIGCASPHFPDGMMPFFNHLPDIHTKAVILNVKKLGAALTTAALGGIGIHFTAGLLTKRIGKHWQQGTLPRDSSLPETPEQLKQELDDLIRRQEQVLAAAKKVKTIRKRTPRKHLLRRLLAFCSPKNNNGKE